MRKAIKNVIGISFGTTLLLAGCSNDGFANSAKEQIKENEKIANEQKETEKKEKEKAAEIYVEMEKPLNEVINDNELDKKNEQKTDQVVIKDRYSDANEFALRLSKEIFEFNTGKSDPEVYYQFLNKFGSESFKKEWIPTEEEGVLFLQNIQEVLKGQDIYSISYQVTDVELNSAKSEGYFYRKETLNTEDEAYYITTIIKENGSWMYQDDSPSPPFEEVGGNDDAATNREE
ncbi:MULTISPECIES: hypothetical protein [Metabacillus]|uniref:hypothetical protein n=1 Tax=Metabacillus TaxID=2675233 RepID=UPI000C7FDE50|nr:MULTISPECIES: hypothetical protein [Metabacillus]MCM3443597.1 hypothetical protein [Metabacillus halosaccharovorans]PMC34243.1 hypothetical protein CJ195_24305 [Bacillus sp. UMB0899]